MSGSKDRLGRKLTKPQAFRFPVLITTFSLVTVFFIAFLLRVADFRLSPIDNRAVDAQSLAQASIVLRLLSSSGELETLADVLDDSMALIPVGEFFMGSEDAHIDEKPKRVVYLDGFAIDRFETTNLQYRRFLLATGAAAPRYWVGSDYPDRQALYPVAGVSWSQARDYCAWAGKRLPTEAEWEKACRGSEGRIYPWGDRWEPRLANTGFFQADQWPNRLDDGWNLLAISGAGNNLPGLQPAGSSPAGASPYGLLDMAGNVSEWVFDWYNWAGYAHMPQRNPLSLGPPWNHVVRGSAWFSRLGQQGSVSDMSRCASRSSSHSYDDPRIGFRCAKTLVLVP